MWKSLILCVLYVYSISAQLEILPKSPGVVCDRNLYSSYPVGEYYRWDNNNQIYIADWFLAFTTGPDIHRLSRLEVPFGSGLWNPANPSTSAVHFGIHKRIIGGNAAFENQPLGTYEPNPVHYEFSPTTVFDFVGTGLDVPLEPATSYGLYVTIISNGNDYLEWGRCSSDAHTGDYGYTWDGIYLINVACNLPCVRDMTTQVYPYASNWNLDFRLFAEIDNLIQSGDAVSAPGTNFCNNKKTVDFLVPQGRYFIYKNFNGDYRSYVGILTNGVATPKTISKFLDSDGAYSVISWTVYPPTDVATQVLSRFDIGVPPCGAFFGPETYSPACGSSSSSSLTFNNLFPLTTYYLYPVADFTENPTGPGADVTFTTGATQTTETVTYNTFSEKYILISKSTRGEITSRLQIINVNFVSFTSDILPDTVVKGWYRFITITAASPACSTSVSCKFDNVLVDAIPMDANKFRCFTPPLNPGSHTFAILSNGALYPAKTIQVEDHSSYIDSEIVPFDNTKATIKWNASETTTYLGSSRIEAFTYVQSGSYLKFTQIGGAIGNVPASSSSFLWTVPSNLQFLVIRTTYRKTNSANYIAQSWVMVDCHTSYCGRREFCNRYYGSQPTGTTTNALTPVDLNCQNLAYCLSQIGCVGTCTSNFISGLSNFALGRQFNNNPYALGNPVSSSNTQSDINWVNIATQLYGKNFDIIYREDYPPRVCPVKPVLDTPIQNSICGDPHFSTGQGYGSGVYFDIQEVGEFNWFTGFVRYQDSGNPAIDYSAQATVIDIQLTWYVTNQISFLTGMSFRSRENPNGAFVLSTKGGVLTAYDNGVPVTPNGQPYYFVGGNVKLTSGGAEIFLNDGIQISASYWYNLICATITISGVFKDVTGIYGSVSVIPGDSQNNQGNCGGQSFLVPKPMFNHNTQLADCNRVPTASSAFFQYGLGVNAAGNYARDITNYNQIKSTKSEEYQLLGFKEYQQRKKSVKRDEPNALCESIDNEFFREMCNKDLPVMAAESGITPEELFEKMTEAALNVDLPSAVEITFTFNRNGNNLVISYVATINGFAETSATLNLRSNYASVYNLDASSPWVDEATIPFVGTTSGQFTVADAGCDVMYYASGKVDIDTSSSGWKTDSYSITGNCVEAAAPAEDVTPDTTPVDVTTQGISTGQLTTQAQTTGALTSQSLTTQSLTTQPLTTQPITTKPLTTQPLTTGQMTPKQFCETRNQGEWNYGSGYYCTGSNGNSFIQCYGEAPYTNGYQFACASGTLCHCSYGVECTLGGTQSPCTSI